MQLAAIYGLTELYARAGGMGLLLLSIYAKIVKNIELWSNHLAIVKAHEDVER